MIGWIGIIYEIVVVFYDECGVMKILDVGKCFE